MPSRARRAQRAAPTSTTPRGLTAAQIAHSPGGRLAARLWPVADDLIYGCANFRRSARADFAANAQMAVFLAFRQLGGDVSAPEAFDWVGQRESLFHAARALLRQSELGELSDHYDARQRSLPRVLDAHVSQADCWRYGDEQLDPAAVGVGDATYCPQEAAYYETELKQLLPRLRARLTPREYALLERHYLQGVRQVEMAREIAASDPRYAGPQGVKRAENMIHKAMERAQRHARELVRAMPDYVAYARDLTA
jgi:hypothetical protein